MWKALEEVAPRVQLWSAPATKALTRSRLVHVDQYYLRADTIATANAALIEAQAKVPIVAHWGNGLLASVVPG